jgi:16S rRNA (uracil1498-N3)-methyltransferase
MSHRLFVDAPLAAGAELVLPPDVSRHAQVLRLQPGDALHLFNGLGGQWQAQVLSMGRQSVSVSVLAHEVLASELPRRVTLALGMPANDRMDALVEKATELGVDSIQPLHTSRSVLRLSGERAEKRCAHWQAVAVAASEQSGRERVPHIAPVRQLADWLAALPTAEALAQRWLLSFAPDGQPPAQRLAAAAPQAPVLALSGPEGGLDPQEEALARQCGFAPVSLGPRTLRADTAPLVALSWIGLQA